MTEALEQQTATSEILRVISRSPMDYQPVFDTIVQHATRLCRGRFGTVYRFDGQLIHLAAHYNLTPEAVAALHEIYPTPNPTPNTRGLVGPAIREGRIVHVADVQAAYSGPSSRMASILGFHSQIVVPMLREDTCIGALSIAREERGLFPSIQVELLKTFADQAVLAIENVRLFREIEIKSRELEAASQHKSQFLANMSHELRTPLNAIIGVTDLLLEDARDLNRADEIEPLERVLRAGRHLLALINSILDLAKIEAGHMELELDDFHLSPAIDDTLLLMRERAGGRRLALERHVDGRVGEIRGDQQKVKQVLLNLLSNAVKFTPEGGRIDVRAALVDGTVEISVTDTGI
ncbi:MAG TPA: histidine kinase dimerization/phospho-acceptor domain-containing protein, partial [Methylomirabilota bacterium]|nr:histidine kinase dimerization/phospho-acceptor domain-containing protein [Methylomirabilota bacterium]